MNKELPLDERIQKLFESSWVNEFNHLENQLLEARYLLTCLNKKYTQLTNNWNELEECVRKLIDDNNNRYELYKDDKLHYEYEISNIKYQNNMLVAFLDKMKEIKEGNNE